MKRLFALSALLIFLVFPGLAMAAEVVNPIGEALSGLLTGVVFPVLSALLLGLVGVLLNKLRQKYNINLSEAQQKKMEQLALQGIAYAEEKAAAKLKAGVTTLTGKEKLDLAIAHILAAAPAVSPAAADQLVHVMLGRVFGAGATGKAAVSQ